MSNPAPTPDHPELNHATDLETVLNAWNTATTRLQHTHEALREEVRRLTDELEVKNRELARKNRLADLGQMASHVAHEVRNNLVPVTLYLSLLKRRLAEDPDTVTIVDKINTACTALDATVNDLLHFTADRDPRRQTIAIAGIVEEVISSLRPQLLAQGISTELDIRATEMVHADPEMLRRAILNLTLNAIDVMPDGGELVITGYQGASGYELEIADSGPGLPEADRRRIFEPFYTTKNGGTGLGLAIVCRIVESHGGGVTAVNCPEGGAAFTIHLPRRAAMEKAA